MGETIFALSSGRPPAAISVIRISGTLAKLAGSLMASPLPEARTAAVRELRHPRTLNLLDESLVLCFESPASSTGEDVVEFHCHGGRAVVDAVLGALSEIEGLREARPGEFTRRAFENGRIDLTEAEGLADLIEAETEAQRRSALILAEGGLRRQIATWQQQLLGLSAQAELAIDYDEDDQEIDQGLLRESGALAAELREWLARPRAERLRDGPAVVIAGPPNAGKSSLINAIVGYERAIVTDVPGTTRDHIEVPLALGGLPIRLIDTAGLRQTEDQVESLGVERAEKLVEAADVVIWLGDPAAAPDHPRMIKVAAKADLPSSVPPMVGQIPVSSVSGAGLADLLLSVETKVRSLLPADDAIALNRRQAQHIEEAATALSNADLGYDLALVAEELRSARNAFDRLTGRAGVEEVLDALFGRFCLGK